jgi:hypothetical protein
MPNFRSNSRPRSRRPTALRPFAFSVAFATAGVGLLYFFLLPRLTGAEGSVQPLVTSIAVQAGRFWGVAALLILLGSAWLLRSGARDRSQLLGRFLLNFLLLLDVLMVALSLAGVYAAVAALPGRVFG